MRLKRGTPVIVNDCDAPEARMVAILTKFDEDLGMWRARYLSRFPHRTFCHCDSPTPIAAFGMWLELSNDTYRVFPSSGPETATYADGKPRRWQGAAPSGWYELRPNTPTKALRRAA
jgi:hypothetical protein